MFFFKISYLLNTVIYLLLRLYIGFVFYIIASFNVHIVASLYSVAHINQLLKKCDQSFMQRDETLVDMYILLFSSKRLLLFACFVLISWKTRSIFIANIEISIQTSFFLELSFRIMNCGLFFLFSYIIGNFANGLQYFCNF